MKRLNLTILVLAIIISAVNYQAIAKNQAVNPGFEDGTGTDADDWNEASFQVSRSSDAAHSGSYSMKISGDWGWQTAKQDNSNDYNGKWAQLSVYLMTPSSAPVTNSRIFIQMRFYRSDGVDDWRELAVQGDTLTQDSWAQFLPDGTEIPAGTTNILITLTKEVGYGTVYFDDINLNITDDCNPSFESPGSGNVAWYWYCNAGSIERSETVAHTGEASLKIFDNPGYAYPASEEDNVPVAYGEKVEVDMYAYTPSGDPLKVDAGLQLFWSDGTYDNHTVLTSNTVEDSWVHAQYTVFVPSGVTDVDIRPIRFSPTAADDGTVYFDDVNIVVSAIPEPAVIMLLGLLGLYFCNRK